MNTKVIHLLLTGLIVSSVSACSPTEGNAPSAQRAIEHVKKRWGHCFEKYEPEYTFQSQDENVIDGVTYTTVFVRVPGEDPFDFSIRFLQDGEIFDGVGGLTARWLFIEGCEQK